MKICQICGMHPATTHIKQSINGCVTEVYVCSQCASSSGIGFANNEAAVGNMLSGLFSRPLFRTVDQTAVCPTCGSTYPLIVRRGRVGCPDCYITFYDQLSPSVQRIHGKSMHVGRSVAAEGLKDTPVDALTKLKQELADAVEAQEFERCATLRDQIKEWEAKNSD